MRRFLLLLTAVFGCLGGALLLAAPALAHASVVTSSPADGSRLKSVPRTVTITFDENVGLGGIGYLHVTNGAGKRVDAGAATHPGGDGTKVADTLVGGLGNGTYTASYRVISADSHPVAGTIRFVVGNGALAHGSTSTTTVNHTTSVVFDVARWVSYGGFAVLGGAWLLLTIWPQGRDDRRARRIVWGGWGVTAFGAAAELLLQGPYADGAGPGRIVRGALLDDTLHTDYGQLHCLRLLLLGLLALVFARSLQVDARPARWEAVAGAFGIGIAFSFSAAGHAGTTSPAWLSVIADMAHLLAMSAWIGGLVLLVAAVLPRREPDELQAVLPTFSTVAFVSVVTLAVSGSYAAWRGIGTVHAIFTTTYGLLVVAKVVLFVGLLAVANLSRLLVRRRVAPPQLAYAMTDAAVADTDEGAADEDTAEDADEDTDDDAGEDQVDDDEEVEDGEFDGDGLMTERLRRSVLTEVAVALVVLALTAVLVAEPRGKEALAQQYRDPVSATAALGGGRTVTVTSDPGTHGTVSLTVTLSPGAKPSGITATATQEKAQLGPIPVKLSAASTDTYDGSASLPVSGAWDIDLIVTASAFDATTTDVTLHLH